MVLFIYRRNSLWHSTFTLACFYSCTSILFSLFSSSARASLFHPGLYSQLNLSSYPPHSRGSERKGRGSVGYLCCKLFQPHKANSLQTIAAKCSDLEGKININISKNIEMTKKINTKNPKAQESGALCSQAS